MENLGDKYSFNRQSEEELPDIERGNVEIPEQEDLEYTCRWISSNTDTDTVGDEKCWLDSADSKKNLNLNRWSPYKLCMNQKEEVDSGNNIVSVVENNLDFVQKANTSIFIAGTHHLNFSHLSSVTEETPQLCGSHIEDGFSIINIDDKNTSPLNSTNSPSDIGDHGEVDSHFSSVDFPSPPLSIDLYVQDEKLESLDDSFPSPPSEAQEFISHISVEDFIACTDAESYVSLESNIGISQPPVQHFSPDRGGHKEILAQLPTVCVTMHDDNNPTFNSETQNNYNNTIQKNSPMTPSPPQPPLNTLPELLLSEWKDLDEEPLEDFEKLEQLCCISGDEGDALGELFLGKLKILESLKRTPDQNTMDDEEKSEETCDPTAAPDLSNLGSKLNIISDQSDLMGKSTSSIILDSQEKSNDLLRSLVQTSEVKDQGSLSKMTTKNGLMMQVCEERLQFSLSENVKTNVLWGETIKDTVMLRPWGEPITESSELVIVTEQREDESKKEEESVFTICSDESKAEPLTVMKHPEVSASQNTANQAMKGFNNGPIGSRLSRRRDLSSGADSDEDEDELEDEGTRRVIVVTETDVDKRVGLRSLLKSPKEPMDREKDRGRNVSFFDDVTIYLFDQETPTNELSMSASTSPTPVSVKSSKLDLHGPNSKSKETKRKDGLALKPRSTVGANPVTSSRFTVSPADEPHLV
ncbi:uncharacterized protein LOC103387854 isoform X2 [Cynoglossus semilaevis]|uniref:uncharacterized protein LOC103387854 isoform X2 n=1 Tax=Cynoglossus semilaevis TaxID=244447 RepID=UPI000495A6A8|nr:uncharacterized protein LOC103387854 isoform X2 [Cynoglossus semilaevis]